MKRKRPLDCAGAFLRARGPAFSPESEFESKREGTYSVPPTGVLPVAYFFLRAAFLRVAFLRVVFFAAFLRVAFLAAFFAFFLRTAIATSSDRWMERRFSRRPDSVSPGE